MGKDPAECARMCVHDMGGAYVLLTKTSIYKLDDQKAADTFVGKSVRIEENGSPFEGVTEGLDDRGFLRVRTAQGMQTVLSGTVREK